MINSNKAFPDETSDGIIYIEGNTIYCSGNHRMSNCEVNIDTLQYAYIVVNSNNGKMLFLFDYRHNYLPTYYSGFRKVYEWLSVKFGFDDEIFFSHVQSETNTKKEIWRKSKPATFVISKDEEVDYDKGFEILSPEKDFLSWNRTYDTLKDHPNIYGNISQ